MSRFIFFKKLKKIKIQCLLLQLRLLLYTYITLLRFSRWQSDDIHFMHIVSKKRQFAWSVTPYLVEKIRKIFQNISKCCLLKFLRSVQIVKGSAWIRLLVQLCFCCFVFATSGVPCIIFSGSVKPKEMNFECLLYSYFSHSYNLILWHTY